MVRLARGDLNGIAADHEDLLRKYGFHFLVRTLLATAALHRGEVELAQETLPGPAGGEA